MFQEDSTSPCFSEFRDLMDRWDYASCILEQESTVDKILEKHGVILFFKKGKDLFGAPEESRVVFAKLKTDTDEEPLQPGFREEVRFPAVNLLKCMDSEDENAVESVFGLKDLPKIKVIDKEKAIEIMTAHKNKK